MDQETPMKICLTCGDELPLDNFPKDKSKPDGHRATCKPCRSKALAEWRQTPVGKENDRRKSRSDRIRRRNDKDFAQSRRDIVNRSMARPEYKKKLRALGKTEEGKQRKRASGAVDRAIAKGDLVRPVKCELCGSKPGTDKRGYSKVRAIHTKGYEPEHYLHVVFMCPRCIERWKKFKKC